MAATVADMIVERLIDWGVEVIFGLPGDGVDGIFEALRTHADKLKFIQVRHEEAAAFAACGYAKFTGRLGVCIAMKRELPPWKSRSPKPDRQQSTEFISTRIPPNFAPTACLLSTLCWASSTITQHHNG